MLPFVQGVLPDLRVRLSPTLKGTHKGDRIHIEGVLGSLPYQFDLENSLTELANVDT